MRKALLVLLSFLTFGVSAQADDPAYEINSYEARFVLLENSSDVLVTLDLTYHILDGVKSDGFKYVGSLEPVDAEATDGDGKALSIEILHHRENQVHWSFDPTGPGLKRVIVRFRLKNALTGNRDSGNTLNVPWAGVFKVPVHNAVYMVVLPPGMTPTRIEAPNFEQSEDGGRIRLRWAQDSLSTTAFSVQLTPGTVDAPIVDTPSSFPWVPITLIGLFVAFIVFVVTQAGKATGTGGTKETSGGGCGGGGVGEFPSLSRSPGRGRSSPRGPGAGSRGRWSRSRLRLRHTGRPAWT